MLQHGHHECACATSLTFTFTTAVFEVLQLKVAECRGIGKFCGLRVNKFDRECR